MGTERARLGEECIEADEKATIERIVETNFSTLERDKHPVPRGQHPKHHGCVEARFIVEPGLPADLRVGLFAEEKAFDALIRFSNGKEVDDRTPDAHGMAIKLLRVPGPKLLEGREDETTHDFVLVDSEVFFSAELKGYAEFNENFAEARKGAAQGILFVIKELVTDPLLLLRARQFGNQRLSSPLTSNYWSTTPYRLGDDHAVKYMAVARESAAEPEELTSENGLSEALVAHLAQGGASFDFGVHLQADPVAHPIEDPTVNWSENGARFVKLATIVIPQQAVVAKSDLAERLVFSPWHAIEEHRPLGAINRARRDVYAKMAKGRHDLNGVTPAGSSMP